MAVTAGKLREPPIKERSKLRHLYSTSPPEGEPRRGRPVVLSAAKDLIAGATGVPLIFGMRSFAALRMTTVLGVPHR
jgi:hypothetical protein